MIANCIHIKHLKATNNTIIANIPRTLKHTHVTQIYHAHKNTHTSHKYTTHIKTHTRHTFIYQTQYQTHEHYRSHYIPWHEEDKQLIQLVPSILILSTSRASLSKERRWIITHRADHSGFVDEPYAGGYAVRCTKG